MPVYAALCRERCGGQGYLSCNRFGELIGFAHAGMTAEGDNRWGGGSLKGHPGLSTCPFVPGVGHCAIGCSVLSLLSAATLDVGPLHRRSMPKLSLSGVWCGERVPLPALPATSVLFYLESLANTQCHKYHTVQGQLSIGLCGLSPCEVLHVPCFVVWPRCWPGG